MANNSSNIHLPHWKTDWKLPGLSGLYFNVSLRGFAVSIINIFIPIFLLTRTGNMHYVFLYYFINNLFTLILYYPLTKLMTKIGPDSSSLLSNILLGLYLYALTMIKNNYAYFPLAAVLEASMVPLYWIPYHLAFVKLGEKESLGHSLSWVSVISRVATALGPLIGGILIVGWGFEKVFSWVVVIILFSTIPLFLDNFTKTSELPPFGALFKSLLSKKYRLDLLAFMGVSWEAVIYAIFWPIFLYQMVDSFKVVGAISSAALIFSMIFLLWVGKGVDKGKKGIFRLGMLSNSANWIVRIFLNSGWQFFLSDFFYQIGTVLLWMPFDATVYKKAGASKPLEFLLKRAWALQIGGTLIVMVVWLIWELYPSWLLIFCLGIVGIMLSGFMVREKKSY